MTYVSMMHSDTGLMSAMVGQTLGSELKDAYNTAVPFPHIVIDDFLPAEVLGRVLKYCETIEPNEESQSFRQMCAFYKSQF